MEKKIALFAVALIIVFVSNSIVLALVPMGPPKALLGQDRWDIGIEYGYQTMDLEAVGPVQDIQPGLTVTRKEKHNIDNLKSNIVMARASYGINDNWDAFALVGVVDAQADIERTFSDGAPSFNYKGFDGSFGIAWGFGTRATFWQDDEVSWGGLLQITWMEPGDSSISQSGDPNFSGDGDINIREVQIAAGPTWRVDENLRIYGGPFLHFVEGDLDYSGRTVDMGDEIRVRAKGDIEEKSQFGGYVGAHMDVDKNTFCCLEFQYTSDAWGIGIGAARRF